MAMTDWLLMVGAVSSGMVSVTVIVSIAVDAVTRGWVRGIVQKWLGIKRLRQDHRSTQVFILDMGDSLNELVDTVCEEHDIVEDDRPSSVKTTRYEYIVEEQESQISRGDFQRGDDD